MGLNIHYLNEKKEDLYKSLFHQNADNLYFSIKIYY